jgi:hypothetical protein
MYTYQREVTRTILPQVLAPKEQLLLTNVTDPGALQRVNSKCEEVDVPVDIGGFDGA